MRKALAGLVGLVLLGCGGAGDALEDKASEVAAEKLLEASGAGKVDLKSDGSVTIDNGSGTVALGSGASLPSDWPSALPTPTGSTVQAASRTQSPVAGKYDFTGMFENAPLCPDTMAWYKGQLGGWTSQAEANFEGSWSAQYLSPDKTATVQIACTETNGHGSVVVSYLNVPAM